MCELFGMDSAAEVCANELLQEFCTHSDVNPDGWGLAVFRGNVPSIEKEPVRAMDSVYLKQRLRHKIKEKILLAHIRQASVGSVDYENCHPFVRQDAGGRWWTLIHNGTIFHGDILNPYFYRQEGRTDSERILYYLIDRVNLRRQEYGRELDDKERFALLEDVVRSLARGNKLNFLLYDGDMMYAHMNYAHSLYVSQPEGTVFLASKPLGKLDWKELPLNTLFSYRDGKQISSGQPHDMEYIYKEEDMKYLHLDSAEL